MFNFTLAMAVLPCSKTKIIIHGLVQSTINRGLMIIKVIALRFERKSVRPIDELPASVRNDTTTTNDIEKENNHTWTFGTDNFRWTLC